MRLAYIPPKRKQVLLSPEQRKPVRTAVRSPDTTVIADVIAPLENCYNLSESLLETVISQEITSKRQKEGQNHSPVRKKSATAAGLLFLTALTCTLVNVPLKYQCGLYLLSFSVLVLYDSFSLFCLIWSLESRRIISFLTVLVAVGVMIFSGTVRYWMAVSVLAAVGLCAIKLLNYRWIKNENYCMDESTEGSIVNSPESVAYKAYISQGKTKCRTLALRQNFQFTEKILDGCFGLFYRLGYWDGWKKTEQVNVNMQKLTERAETAEQEARETKEELDRVKKELELIEKERTELKDQIESSKWSAEYAQKRYSDISFENIRLTAANEELLSMLNKESPVEDLPEVAAVSQRIKESGEDRARELLKQGRSIRKTVELSGVSFYNVNRLRKELLESGELATDEKIVSIKSATA